MHTNAARASGLRNAANASSTTSITNHAPFIAIRRLLVRSDHRMSELPRLWVRSPGTDLRNQKTGPSLVTKSRFPQEAPQIRAFLLLRPGLGNKDNIPGYN